MKKHLILLITIFYHFSTYAQEEEASAAFDFWVGKWTLTWDEGNGSIGKATNNIVKILDDKVIQENFEILEGAQKGFKGTSISVYNPKTKQWHQAWADNQGSYFDFTGAIEGDKKIFKTRMIEKEGKKIIRRMVFYNIQKERMTWDWEGSEDGGKSWKLLWRINYKKVNE
ncbi:hypothetical protein QQ020_03375 [Fulvivirgaceae bacterium BMA12]|uniref:DUF1579 domain-containing protein n=1 Tax=Agaribacillus aureus TaxID=3051825 RepID=A0ABT8L499_9BACT|nr:hypothetical protein [Fulvivirgaceae bacterium BMA12]